REQELMLGHLHVYGMKVTRQHLSSEQKGGQIGAPNSWLGQQRRNVSIPCVILSSYRCSHLASAWTIISESFRCVSFRRCILTLACSDGELTRDDGYYYMY